MMGGRLRKLFDSTGTLPAMRDALAKGARKRFMPLFKRPRGSGRYEIKRKLGQGSSGIVYQVWDRYIKRDVAVKVSRPNSNRFMAEAQSAGRLKHPNIVAVHDASVQGDICYITMEYVEGPTIETFCRQETLLPPRRVLEILINVCNALDYAHRKGIIHRDIKPSNIMLDKEGDAKIGDFGIAQMTEKTVPFGVFGTPSYMSPEQLKEESVSKASDIFSLGCVLYEMLTGEKAFSGDHCFAVIYKVINEEPPAIKGLRPELPEVLDKIVKKALSKDPQRRYRTCMDLADELRVALRGLSGLNEDEKVKDLVGFVRNLPFFHCFTKQQVRGLIAASHIVKTRKGKVIVSEGEINDTFYVILKGRAKVRKDGQDIAFIEAGECFGEMGCIGGQARVANVVADVDCILMKIRAALLDHVSQPVQLLFYKTFSMILVNRLSKTAAGRDSLGAAHSRGVKRAS